MKQTAVMMLIMAAILVSTFGQKQNETKQSDKFARQLRQFESDWLTANLNRNEMWLGRLLAGKLIVVPSEKDAVKIRAQETIEMIDPKLKPDEMKIRITGNITLLTNAGNSSFYFLDTFNKRGDKWQMIASHFSSNPESNNENIEQTLLRLERELSAASVSKNTAKLKQIIADDFAGVESSGRIINKNSFIADIESGEDDVQSETPENMKVRILGDTAFVTGYLFIKGKKKEGTYNLSAVFTDIWAKQNGQWQIVHHQVTTIK